LLVHILTCPVDSQNSWSFFAPLDTARRELRALGISVRKWRRLEPAVPDCDVLLLDDKFFGVRWGEDRNRVLDELLHVRNHTRVLVYCDTGDSSGLLRAAAMPLVDRYFKGFVLKDRNLYQRPLYGGRLYTHFYWDRFRITDRDPQWSEPIEAESVRRKLRASWSYGLADHGPWSLIGRRLFPLGPPRQLPAGPFDPGRPLDRRPVLMSHRFGTNYSRETVAFQRQRMRQVLGLEAQPPIRRWLYLRELARSRAVLSPFGWGEFAFRDYEVFLSGALLLKPDMSHLETFPDYYRDGETMLALRWDFADIREKIELVAKNPSPFNEIAAEGMRNYFDHLSRSGRERFAFRLKALLLEAGIERTAGNRGAS
jgi:hypothetical protein